jgi:hypothetical protein
VRGLKRQRAFIIGGEGERERERERDREREREKESERARRRARNVRGDEEGLKEECEVERGSEDLSIVHPPSPPGQRCCILLS